MKSKHEKHLIIILTIAVIFFLILILNLWNYKIDEITADNYTKKLSPIKEGLWEVNVEDCIPKIDAQFFSITEKTIFNQGLNYGMRMTEKTQLNTNINYYHFEPVPSQLEYSALYSTFNGVDVATEIRIGTQWREENSIKLKEIISKLCANQGFQLKRSLLIFGCDIIIKETDKGFIIGRVNTKYDYRNSPLHGLYIEYYTKNIFYSTLSRIMR